MIRIYVIGCGGIGGVLCDLLPSVCAGTGLRYIKEQLIPITTYLTDAGHCVLPSIVNSITLIDGDRFEPRNALRQGEGAGNKLAQRLSSINSSMVRLTYLRNVSIIGHNTYLTPSNMELLIPLSAPVETANMKKFEKEICSKKTHTRSVLKEDKVVILVGVDNFATRHDICHYAEKFDNILVINGGNEVTYGEVTIYERKDGKALDPNFTELYPNVRNPTDLRPDQIHCTDASPQLDQTVLANTMIATVMMSVLDHWIVTGTLDDFNTARAGRTGRRNEIVVDMMQCSMSALLHQLAPEKVNATNGSNP